MAAPNLAASGLTWKSDTAIQIATTSLVDVTWPIGSVTAVPTGHVFVVDAFYLSNYHASQAAYATVVVYRASAVQEIVARLRVASGQMLNGLLGKPLYLAEADKVQIKADVATSIKFFAPYSDVN